MKKQTLFNILIVLIFTISLTACGEQETPTPASPAAGSNRPAMPEGGRMGGGPGGMMNVVAEATGLSMQEIRELTADSEKTLADIITENGGDVEAVKAQLLEAFEAMPQPDNAEFSPETMVDNLLNGTGGFGGRMGGGQGQSN